MKSLLWLTLQVLENSGTRCGVKTERDRKTILSRVEREGNGFLTITLPAYVEAIFRCLADGCFDHTVSFSRKRQGLPVLLRGFLSKIFDVNGKVRVDVCIDSISCLKQIGLLHKKFEAPCTESRNRAAERAYLDTERELRSFQWKRSVYRDDFVKVAAIVSTTIFGDFNDEIYKLEGKHGPGTTADGTLGNQKYRNLHDFWYSRLDRHFPYSEMVGAAQAGLLPPRRVQGSNRASSPEARYFLGTFGTLGRDGDNFEKVGRTESFRFHSTTNSVSSSAVRAGYVVPKNVQDKQLENHPTDVLFMGYNRAELVRENGIRRRDVSLDGYPDWLRADSRGSLCSAKWRWVFRNSCCEPPKLFDVKDILLPELEVLPDPQFTPPRDELPVRVVFVPKTQSTPRVIATEPVCMQFVQQALAGYLTRKIESCPPTSGQINFVDQSINRSLAQSASRNGEYATLDMKDASDRVSAIQVSDMLRAVPLLRDAVMAARSTRALLPSGMVVNLRKFASMGSATCFPIEALAFFCAIVTIQIRRLGLIPSSETVRRIGRSTFVYGDDIVVPVDVAPYVAEDLSSFGWKVNGRKSFWTGKFRESCGGEYYDGVWITPARCRKVLPSSWEHVDELAHWVSLSNTFYLNGFWQVARAIRKRLSRFQIPHANYGTGLCYYSFSNYTSINRWNSKLHRFEYRTVQIRTAKAYDPISGYEALSKVLPIIGRENLPDRDHLTCSPVRFATALKRSWASSSIGRPKGGESLVNLHQGVRG